MHLLFFFAFIKHQIIISKTANFSFIPGFCSILLVFDLVFRFLNLKFPTRMQYKGKSIYSAVCYMISEICYIILTLPRVYVYGLVQQQVLIHSYQVAGI